jgi:hypothetical protein
MNSRSKVYSNRLSRRGRDRMVVGLITTITISSITTKVVSSNPAHARSAGYNIM